MRREGTVSLSSDLKIMKISVPDATKDVTPEHMGVTTIALICASVYVMFIQLMQNIGSVLWFCDSLFAGKKV